jgi:amidase
MDQARATGIDGQTMARSKANQDAFRPAWEWMDLLASRKISAVELLSLYESQVAAFNPVLNAVVLQDFDSARQNARQADAQRAEGHNGALLGLPHTVKDCIYVRGFPTTGGLPERRHVDSTSESPLAERLRSAGSIVFGKTNVPPYAADWQSDNPLFGRTLNPWNSSVTPGGSSGGAAAAVAAGLTPIEFGSDMAGSIRVPAAFCGVFGHKTSETLLPRAGHFPGQPRLENAAVGMGVQGPIARCTKDLLLALNVIAGGADARGGGMLDVARGSQMRLADFRVAVFEPPAWLPVDAQVRRGFDDLCAKLRTAGLGLTSAMPPELGDLRDFEATYRSLLSTIEHAAMPAAARQQSAEVIRSTGAGDPFVQAVIAGALASAGDFIGWSGKRSFYERAFARFFERFDILLTPTQIIPPFEHTRVLPQVSRSVKVNGLDQPYGLMFLLPSLANLPGLPALAFPVGITPEGLPLGAQAIGPMLGDMTTLSFVEALEREIGIHAARSPLGS